MKSIARLGVVLGLLTSAQTAFAGDHLPWARDWEEALAEAQARNVPIFLTVHKDN